jgi:hypothetical protein
MVCVETQPVEFCAVRSLQLLPSCGTQMEGGPVGCRYHRTPSGRFDSLTFNDWFHSIIVPVLRRLSRKEVIICDNLSNHSSVPFFQYCWKENMHCVCFCQRVLTFPRRSMYHFSSHQSCIGVELFDWVETDSRWNERRGFTTGFPSLTEENYGSVSTQHM